MNVQATVSKTDIAKVRRLLKNVKKDMRKAMVLALNETIKGGKTDVAREVKAEVNLPSRIIRKGPGGRQTFSTTRARASNPTGRIRTAGKNIPLVHYRKSPKRLSYNPRKISVQVKKTGAVHILKHAFIPKLKSGYMGIFERAGKSRYPIEQLFGPRIPDILSNTKPTRRALDRIDKRMSKNLDRAVTRVMALNKK